MRIAVVSDIHGNLLALDAVMADLERQAPDEIWCGGDLGWLGPWAAECVARVREAGWKTVKGNTDVWITGDPQTVDEEDRRKLLMSIAEQHAVPEDDAQWLVNLPLGHSGPGSMLLVHGTPQSPFVAPMPDAPASEFAPYEERASLVIYGHVHIPFVRKLRDLTFVCNTGAVGLPMDAPTACYLIIDQHGSDWTLQHRRVPYDRRGAIAQAKHTPGPASELFLEYMSATGPV